MINVRENFSFKEKVVKLALELDRLQKLNVDSCQKILDAIKLYNGKIARLMVNSIVNEIEIRQAGLPRIKSILCELKNGICFDGAFEIYTGSSDDEEKMSALIIEYISLVTHIQPEKLWVMNAAMPALNRVVRNDPSLFFSDIYEECVTTQLPFVIKILNDNHLLHSDMLNFLYIDPLFFDKPPSVNQQDWRTQQHKNNNEKIKLIDAKMQDIIKHITAMNWLLFLASKDLTSIFSGIPVEVIMLIMDEYAHVLMKEDKKKITECAFFMAHDKEIDQPENRCTVRYGQ